MHIWTLLEHCLIPFAVGFFGVQFIRHVYFSCATHITSVFQKRRQDAKSKRALCLLFATHRTKELETFHVESGDSCSICLVRLFYFAVLRATICSR